MSETFLGFRNELTKFMDKNIKESSKKSLKNLEVITLMRVKLKLFSVRKSLKILENIQKSHNMILNLTIVC